MKMDILLPSGPCQRDEIEERLVLRARAKLDPGSLRHHRLSHPLVGSTQSRFCIAGEPPLAGPSDNWMRWEVLYGSALSVLRWAGCPQEDRRSLSVDHR